MYEGDFIVRQSLVKWSYEQEVLMLLFLECIHLSRPEKIHNSWQAASDGLTRIVSQLMNLYIYVVHASNLWEEQLPSHPWYGF